MSSDLNLIPTYNITKTYRIYPIIYNHVDIISIQKCVCVWALTIGFQAKIEKLRSMNLAECIINFSWQPNSQALQEGSTFVLF